jgi:hypothetical protein
MTIREKIETAVNSDWSDPLDKLIALAYLAGQEVATKKLCDTYAERVAKMRSATIGLRYYRQANQIVDAAGGDLIYDANYAQDVRMELCADEYVEPTCCA